MSAKTKIRDPKISTMGEKIRFALGDVGCNFIWGFVGSYLTLYYTDSALIAAGVAGTIMLFARLLDGVSDILMGIIIEKTHTKYGKARPWILWMTVPLVISMFLAFHVPAGLAGDTKIAYVAVTYILISAVTYTAVNMSYITLFTLFAPDSNDRNVAATVRTLFAMFAAMGVNIITMPLLTSFGGEHEQAAWDKLALIYGFIALVCLCITFFGVKEKKLSEAVANETEKTENVPMKKVIGVLARTKYFYLAAFLSIAYYMSNGIAGVNVYYARDILGNANLVGLLGVATLPTMIIGSLLAPVLYKKYGKRNIMMVGSFIMIAAAAAQLAAPSNLAFFLAMLAVKGLGVILFGSAISTLPGDIADWSEWKQGVRAEGIVTSLGSFGSKVGVGFGAGIVGLLLSMGGYDGAAAIQQTSALNAEIALMIGVPLALGIIQVLLLLVWDMDKIHPEIMAELEKKRA